MRNKLGSSLILSLAINALMFSGASQAASFRWNSLKLTINDMGLGIDSSTNKQLLVSLPAGYSTVKTYDAVLKFTRPGYTFKIGGKTVANNTKYSFSVKYGSKLPIMLYNGTTLVDTYNLVFTNLPVVQITAPGIADGLAALPGTLRVINGVSKVDTGVLNMNVDYAGSVGMASRQYPKKPYHIDLGKAKDVALLDLSKRQEWILDAPYRDKSFSRAAIVDDVFSAIKSKNTGLVGKTASRSRAVEVIVDGKYSGVYLLKEPVDLQQLGLKPVNVPVNTAGRADWKKVDFTKPENGSVVYRVDFGDTIFSATTPAQLATNFTQIYPAPADALNPAPLKNLINFVATSTNAVFTRDIAKYVDLDSLASWWVLAAATQSTDNINKGFYLAKNASGKFFVAPSNAEASFGLAWDGSADPAAPVFGSVSNNLIKRLTALPATGFNTRLKDKWIALRDPGTAFDKAVLVARFKKLNGQVVAGGANLRNDAVWPKSTLAGVVAAPKAGTVGYVDTFLTTRLANMDTYIELLQE